MLPDTWHREQKNTLLLFHYSNNISRLDLKQKFVPPWHLIFLFGSSPRQVYWSLHIISTIESEMR